ncbi:MAG: hypothetical protein J7K46_08470 [Bacteroidales bacterium]|nr:hypothetical protein [Bacteroidales bacterium]
MAILFLGLGLIYEKFRKKKRLKSRFAFDFVDRNQPTGAKIGNPNYQK